MTVIFGQERQVNLQATLSTSSAVGNEEAAMVRPHHPITCASDLRFEPDGTLTCEHATAPSDDQRTLVCVNHSLALLLMELALEL